MNLARNSQPLQTRFGYWKDLLIFGIILPVGINVFCYFGYISGYTGDTYSSAGFLVQYLNGIYKYRVLGRELLLLIADRLESLAVMRHLHPPKFAERTIPFLDSSGSFWFYTSYFLLNTLFFCITALFLVLILQSSSIDLSDREKRSRIALLLLMIGLSQFVVVPYDLIAYAILASSIYLSLQYFHQRSSRRSQLISVVGLVACIILGTLNRETATLTLSSFAIVGILTKNLRNRNAQVIFGILTILFLATYVALRFYYGFANAAFESIGILKTLPATNVMGLLLCCCFGWLFLQNFQERSQAKVIILCSLPYLAGSLLFGIWFEIRLWMPILLMLGSLASSTFQPSPETTRKTIRQ